MIIGGVSACLTRCSTQALLLLFADNERRGILELTMLLVTGQASQPLSSILAGGESTSDRVGLDMGVMSFSAEKFPRN